MFLLGLTGSIGAVAMPLARPGRVVAAALAAYDASVIIQHMHCMQLRHGQDNSCGDVFVPECSSLQC